MSRLRKTGGILGMFLASTAFFACGMGYDDASRAGVVEERTGALATAEGALTEADAEINPLQELASAGPESRPFADVSLSDPIDGKLSFLLAYWSPYTSEEYPPLTCQNRYLITAMRCRGKYCDNVNIRCDNRSRNYGYNYWSSYFSEEGTNWRKCSAGSYYMTGLACRGKYCDNVSIQCTYLSGTTKSGCYWTSWFSEEAEYLYLPSGYYAAGLRCKGSYCDNKSVYACKAL